MSQHNPFRAFGVVEPAIATERTGLDFLNSMLERRAPSPPFSETTDIWMVSAETGRVVFEAMPSARFHNPMGVIHGGWIATLLDSCMGCVVQSTLKAAQTYTTIEMKTVFVRAAHADTGLLRCEGTLLHSGRRVASSEGKVFDREGRLIAYGSETCLITDLGSQV
ncbi:MAG: PaaI family thioesterase [Phycisphaerales bacterium]|nr:PaaI family thioesterase [Phycisphaerales bacterium]